MDFLSHYLYNGPEFIMFGRIHILSIVFSILGCIVLPPLIVSLKPKVVDRIILYLSFLIMANIFVWMILEFIAGTFDFKSHLPLHLCRVANIMLPIMILSKNKTLYNVLYYWSLSGIFQALITPDITQTFPHYHFIRFFITHNLMIFVVILFSMHKQFRPTISGIWVALFYMNVFLLIVFSVNLLLSSNYFWIMEKPPTSSLLDYLGPWPWYIFFAEFIALFHFAIAYTPVLMERYFKEKRQNLRILSFADFYPYYISQHKIPLNRLFHNIGSVLSISVFVVSIYKNMFFIMFLSPLLGYAFAWYGHFAIEKNKPATFKFPIYSFLGDWLMLWDNIRGVDFNEIIYKFKRNEKK